MNRVESLNRLLQSIYDQSLKPTTLIIVDGSDQPIEHALIRDESVRLIYVREHPPSLTRQRNAGIRAIPDNLTHVGFLDDDLVLLSGCLRSMSLFIESHDERLGGAGFNIQDNRPGRLRFLSILMGHSSNTPGKVCSSGYATSNVGALKNFYTEWLCGGATVWRKSVLNEFAFDEWYKGYALWEDVDFSYRVSRSMSLAIVADARVLHLHKEKKTPEHAARIGDLEIVDRFYFIRKHNSEMSMLMATWASLGTIARNLLTALKHKDPLPLIRARNNVRALQRCLRGNISRGY